MIVERRRILGSFAVLALVLLRLVIGWHFFGEGTKKLQYDRQDGAFRLAFSADDFLALAKGPLANSYYAYMPNDHNWRELLGTPRENVRRTPEQLEEAAKWQRANNEQRAAAAKKGEPAPVDFPPDAPYHDWAKQIAVDWQDAASKLKSVSGITDAQKQQIDKAFDTSVKSLSEYLAGEEEAMIAYRHDLWRLENWRKSPESAGVPFYQQRISTKAAETTGQMKPWLKQVQQLDADYVDDLERVLTPVQRDEPVMAAIVKKALTDPRQDRLDKLNVVVTILTITVGACLLLGFFTRLAAIAGAIFLFGVIASQPFWIPESLPTMPYYIEFAGLLVLAATGPGRWFGLDYFAYAMFYRDRYLELS